ncbi:MAG: DUF4403 family protein [Catalinimonas sp.]
MRAALPLLLLALVACKTLSPDGPEEYYEDIQYQPPLSVLTVPVEVPVVQLQRRLNRELGDTLYVDERVDDDNLALRVLRRNPVRVSGEGDLFHLDVPLRIWAKAGVDLGRFGIKLARYEETEFALNVRFDTRLRVDSNWRLRPDTEAAGFDWITRPELRIAGIRIPVDKLVEGELRRQQRQIAGKIDAAVAQQLDLRTPVAEAWRSVQRPVILSAAHETWLRVRPTEVVMTPLNTRGGIIRGQIGFRGYAETFTGRKPDVGRVPLPPLRHTDAVPADFEVGLLGEVSYDRAAQLLREAVADRTFTFQDGKRTVEVTDVALYGSGADLVAALRLRGDVEGRVFLQGKPRYDPAERLIVVDDLDYSLDTEDALTRAAAWLAHGTFVRRMEEAFRFPVGPQIDSARVQLAAYLDGYQPTEGITLNGEVQELQPGQIFITREGVRALVVGRGTVQLTIEQL